MVGANSIPFDTLLDLFDGRLPAGTARELEARLADASPQTQADADWLRAFAAARARAVLATPPANLHAALLRQFRPSPLAGLLRRAAALLTFDSAAQPALAGVRSVDVRTRQMIFTCDLAEVAMTVRPSRQADRIDVNGQVFSRDMASVDSLVLRLTRADDLLDISLTNQLGEFSFIELPPGAYTMLMVADDGEVEIDEFDVRLDVL
ncbi:MAG: hypothetical protein WCI67_10560 [Chloroflexales bacterium]